LYIRRRFPCCGKLPCLPEESVRRGIFKGRTMFNFRPYVPGFNVEPPAEEEVPGFRMNADGSIRETRAPAARSYPDDGGNPFDIHYRRRRGGELFTPVGDGTPPPYLAYARRLYDGLGGGPTLGFDVAQPSGMTPLAIPSSSLTPDADLTNAPILGASPAAGEPRLESSGTTDPNIVPVGNSDDSQVEVAQAQDQRSGQQTPRPGRNYGLVPQTVIERGMTPLQKKINRDQAFRELTRQPLTAEEARRALPDDWETTKPADIVSEIKRTAERHGVPIQLLARLLYQEGKFNEVDKLGKELRMDSTRKDIPIGYAQMTKNTLENTKNRAAYRGDTKRSEELSTYSLANREQSFDAAAEQLAYLYRLMGGSWPKAVAAYNVGPSLVRWFNGAEIDPQYFTNKADRNGKPLSTDKWTKEVPAYLRFVLRGAAEDPATADMYEPQPPAHYRARDRIDPR
jgi:hypothetical protein